MKRLIRNSLFLLSLGSCFLLAMMLSGCNEKDDVVSIFTDKTWKLTYIGVKGTYGKMFDFWNGDTAANENSIRKLQNNKEYFTVSFNGSEANGVISGAFSGQATSAEISGSWSADGSKRTFSTGNIRAGNDQDVLGRAFINGLRNAQSYSGDTENLYIYYKDGQQEFFLAFKPQ